MILSDLFEALSPGDIKASKRKVNDATEKQEKTNIANGLQHIRDLMIDAFGKNDKILDVFSGYTKEVMSSYDSEINRISDHESSLIKKIFNVLESQCSDILNTYQTLDSYLYRGIKSVGFSENTMLLHGRPYENRRTMNSIPEFNKIFNDVLKESGYIARRDNSTFMTGDINQAGNYGNEFIIFPKNGFSFLWSPVKKDLILGSFIFGKIMDAGELDKLTNYLIQILPDIAMLNSDYAEVLKDACATKTVMSLLRPYDNTNLGRQRDGDGFAIFDFLLNAKKADGSQLLTDQITDMIKRKCVTIDSINAVLKLKTDDLNDAILSDHEIAMTGEYYAIPYTMMDDLRSYLQQRKH